jgi:hypothetical protein
MQPRAAPASTILYGGKDPEEAMIDPQIAPLWQICPLRICEIRDNLRTILGINSRFLLPGTS